jgi:hypothetical protein
MRRLSIAGRAFRPRSGGNSAAMGSHCSSLSSNRRRTEMMEHSSAAMESGIDDYADTP